MLDRFVRLCEIASPTGRGARGRRRGARRAARARGRGRARTTRPAPAEAGAGNLIARVPGAGERLGARSSPTSTRCRTTGPIEVVLDDGVFRSRGETILGADNKAAVAVLMELAARHAAEPAAGRGSSWSSRSPRRTGCAAPRSSTSTRCGSPFGYVLDHASPIGEVIVAAPTYKRLIAEFDGHRGPRRDRPEDGHSAIAAAAAAVAAMELGRLDEETTANVGVIEGGTASNVVAGHCRIVGEARSARRRAGGRRRSARWSTPAPGRPSEHGCDVDVEVTEMFRGYRLSRRARAPVRGRAAALRALRHRAARRSRPAAAATRTRWSPRGFECVLLANGTEANHTPQESVAASADRPRCSRSARRSSSSRRRRR